jgi:hypothetical protein
MSDLQSLLTHALDKGREPRLLRDPGMMLIQAWPDFLFGEKW